ncbi:MAG: AmmeMemoRadiSam system protein A [Gammaproteobacteria bacterium]|nr:AmmeMemoRadiSam system protein A [Gammaproteobacteria bacterium]
MPSIKLSEEDQKTCIDVARASILYGLKTGKPHLINTEEYSAALQQQLASFVTLYKNSQLRGCIGSLEAHQPLINDIAEHAYAAAFHDPRFPALLEDEFKQLSLEISVLNPPQAMSFVNEQDLLQQIRPGIDGLILQYDFNQGTFLPSVWQQLPDKKDFFNHLKVKAGLTTDWWNDNVSVSRYQTLSFEEKKR